MFWFSWCCIENDKDFERNEDPATGFLKWTDFKEKHLKSLKVYKSTFVNWKGTHFFFLCPMYVNIKPLLLSIAWILFNRVITSSLTCLTIWLKDIGWPPPKPRHLNITMLILTRNGAVKLKIKNWELNLLIHTLHRRVNKIEFRNMHCTGMTFLWKWT